MIKPDINKYKKIAISVAAAAALSFLVYSVYKSDMKNVMDAINRADNYCNLAKSDPENRKEYAEKGLKSIKQYWYDSKDDIINFGFLKSKQLDTIETKLNDIKSKKAEASLK